jgi:uncharacterized protein (TIGR03086 family)
MVNHEDAGLDPVDLYRRATARAIEVIAAVVPEQLELSTPCAEWTVQDLLDHLTGGTSYLVAAIDGREPSLRQGTTAVDYQAGVAAVLAGLRDPDVLSRMCLSPLGFEWPVDQAVAGTFMDVLIHTWDLARATGQDEHLDSDLVQVCSAMFLPEMPERGRQAGLVGPAVDVGPNASPQDVLLGAMGRLP